MAITGIDRLQDALKPGGLLVHITASPVPPGAPPREDIRRVSAQIANVLELDELARRVTELIQKTFNYYYVAFFTLKPGAPSLRFRASASAPRPGRRKKSIIVEAGLGQGLIGEAAQSGERQLSDEVRQDRHRIDLAFGVGQGSAPAGRAIAHVRQITKINLCMVCLASFVRI